MSIHNIKGQQVCAYPDVKGKVKLRFYVDDYYHPQLSTHGCLHRTEEDAFQFAEMVVERMGTVNIGKTEAIREACKYVKRYGHS